MCSWKFVYPGAPNRNKSYNVKVQSVHNSPQTPHRSPFIWLEMGYVNHCMQGVSYVKWRGGLSPPFNFCAIRIISDYLLFFSNAVCWFCLHTNVHLISSDIYMSFPDRIKLSNQLLSAIVFRKLLAVFFSKYSFCRIQCQDNEPMEPATHT